MKSFKDNKGRDWPVHIDVRALQRVRDGFNYNLADRTLITDTLQKLFNDDLFVVEVAWRIVQPAALKLNVDDNDFFGSMEGNVIAAAAIVIREELIGFFRDPAIRRVIAGLAEKTLAGMQVMLQGAVAELDAPAPKSPGTSSSTASSSPASSASTPPDSPSESST